MFHEEHYEPSLALLRYINKPLNAGTVRRLLCDTCSVTERSAQDILDAMVERGDAKVWLEGKEVASGWLLFPRPIYRTPYCEEHNSHPGQSCNIACAEW